jgi:transposase
MVEFAEGGDCGEVIYLRKIPDVSFFKRMMKMERSPFLPLPDGMVIDQVETTPTQLLVTVRSTQRSSACPECGGVSELVHSQYQRQVLDTPCAGRSVLLQLHVRKFFCRVPTCRRKVFVERLPDLVRPWARISNRLLEELKAVGLAASGEVSERLAPRLGMRVKAPTLLRYLRTLPGPADASVRVLGIDDFAMRRGNSYGSLLVNLETHRPLDLLPDRTAEAVLPWLTKHQETDVVSRDRASAFAEAAKKALPHATQIADRFHLCKNLREHLQQFLDRKHTCLPVVEDTPLKSVGTNGEAQRQQASRKPRERAARSGKRKAKGLDQSEGAVHPKQPGAPKELDLTFDDRKKKISRDKRYARYEEIRALHQAGMSQRAIALQLHVSRQLVQRFIASPSFPERAPGSGQRPKSQSKLTPYLPYLREQWAKGIHKGEQLFREIVDRGYTGSSSLLRVLLAQWRAELPTKRRQGPARKPRLAASAGQRRLSSRSASFLMITLAEKQTTVQRQQVEQICQASEELHTAYLLSQEFVTMLHERNAEALDGWLKRAHESQVTEIRSFVKGIRRDYDAVRAACSLPWSNGIVEGHVNRLKFLKRQMFGRANLDLLRVKVLHAV